uniref:Uncharacterized protein n=1 Tax=Ditylenchus dipsaci TaxID=166011 RepID=A0A915DG62_9BILA
MAAFYLELFMAIFSEQGDKLRDYSCRAVVHCEKCKIRLRSASTWDDVHSCIGNITKKRRKMTSLVVGPWFRFSASLFFLALSE